MRRRKHYEIAGPRKLALIEQNIAGVAVMHQALEGLVQWFGFRKNLTSELKFQH